MLTPEELKLEAWTWSFSKFKQYQECQEKYRLNYLERMKIPPLSQRPFFQGSVAHKVVEQARDKLLKGEVDSLHKAFDLLDTVFDTHATAINWRDDADLHQARLEAFTLLENYLTLLERMDLMDGDIECEYWFGTHQKPLERPSGLRLVGAIDWLKLDREGGKAWIYDAKTSQGTQYLDKRQLTLYAIAVEQVFGVSVEKVGYLMLRHKKPILHDVTPEEKAALEAEMVEASRLVEQGALGAVPAMKLCGPCQYSGHCGPYRHWILDGGTAAEVEW